MKHRKRVFSKINVIKGTKGVISIFLAILMVPFTTLAGALLTAARVNSASTIYDEMMSNAADSTLADWDSFLKDRFGLLAVNQDSENADYVNDTFKSYLEKNSDVLSNTFFNISSNATGLYSLADTDILKYQILEYSKLSVPTALATNALDIDGIMKSLVNMIPGSQWLNVISSGASMGSAMVDLANSLRALSEAAGNTVHDRTSYTFKFNFFYMSVKNLSDKIAERDSTIAQLESEIENLRTQVEQYGEEATRLTNEVQNLENKKTALQNLLDKLNSQGVTSDNWNSNEDIQDTIDDVVDNGYYTKPDDFDSKTYDDFKKEIKELIDDLSETIKTKKKSDVYQKSAEANNDLANKRSELETKKAQFENEINNLKNAASGEKTLYINAISTLIESLQNEKDKKNEAISAAESTKTNMSSTINSYVDVLSEEDKDKIENQKKVMQDESKKVDEKYSDTFTYETQMDLKNYYNWVGTLAEESESTNENMRNLRNKGSEIANNAVDNGINKISQYTDTKYDEQVRLLQQIKGRVGEYDISAIDTPVLATDSQGSAFHQRYYVDLESTLTKEIVAEAEATVLNELASDSLWDIIKALVNVLKALLSMLLPWDPDLNAKIDSEYYAPISQGWANLSKSNAEDKALSEKYKELFGSSGATDLFADDDADILTCLKTIFEDFNGISGKFDGPLRTITSLFDFGGTIKYIEEKVADIKTQFGKIVDWFSNLAQKFYDKTLLVGYLSYSTSCRTTYTGSSLTGAKFNLRGQTTTTDEELKEGICLNGLVTLFSKTFTGDKSKCFVGAEQEYLLNGKDSEIANQALTWLEIYVFRFVCNIFSIITSTEVATMASCCGPFAWLMYVIVILLEPFIDTALISNGGSVAIVKSGLFLTPSGISSLVNEVLNTLTSSAVSLNQQQKDDIRKDFTNAVDKIGKKTYPAGVIDYSPNVYYIDDNNAGESKLQWSVKYTKEVEIDEQGYKSTKEKTIFKYKREFFKFDYQTYIFLYMFFCSSDKLVERFRNLIQYEAIQKYGPDDTDGNNPVFDLSKSYTYLRCEAQFSTNEFIKLSGSDINMKKRLLYRGY